MPLARTRAVRRPSATNPMSRPTTSAAMALLVYAVMTPETSARHVPVVDGAQPGDPARAEAGHRPCIGARCGQADPRGGRPAVPARRGSSHLEGGRLRGDGAGDGERRPRQARRHPTGPDPAGPLDARDERPPVHQAPARPRRVAGTAGDPLERLPRRGRRRGPGARCRAAAQAIQRYRAAQSRAPADRPGLEDGGPRHGPTMNVRGPEMAPHTPQRSERPGEPVALLYSAPSASSAAVKQPRGARTTPAPIWPTPARRLAIPVLMAGVMEVSTTSRASTPTGLPRSSRAGMRKCGCSPAQISRISAVIAAASAVPPAPMKRAIAHVGVRVVGTEAGEIEALRHVHGGGEPALAAAGDADAEVGAVARHDGHERGAGDAAGGIDHRLSRGHREVQEELVVARQELRQARDGVVAPADLRDPR